MASPQPKEDVIKTNVSPRRMSAPKRAYLVAYNGVSALLWSVVLVRTVTVLLENGLDKGPVLVYPAVGEWTKWTQTLAALEVVHSLLGVVRAPLFTTLMQVSSRFALVWGAVHTYPLIAASPSYSSMLLAWSVTEVVRYLFFALSLSVGAEPYPLRWMRYSGFFALYPVGILSELCELLLAAQAARAEGSAARAAAAAATMLTYLPGAPMLYTHMIKQRRKVLGGGAGAADRAGGKKRQ
ncbi:hypothetical protein KVR01_008506 [Diaporthe batatas]|uniref:uncharacterized protein n=1 Tax=Diaporthe batatas TaxID=748121 RepID=UPI001D049C8D|nr:uncharacterized protein KVR01_008506 [Diaporthe batatas]KAG8161519.1 hypothetical protein KVR01_008506 [Diaporthe batatas]